jgi:predicted HicB family RNase H-like nuclease
MRISVNVCEWALQAYSLSEKQRDTLIKWKRVAEQPTPLQLEDFSKATGIPFGYFLLEEPPAVASRKITFKIEPLLRRDAKIQAIKEGKTLREYISGLIKKDIALKNPSITNEE